MRDNTPHVETEWAHASTVVPVHQSAMDRSTNRSARTDAVVRWIGWHLAEIAVVGGTAVAGFVSHPLWWVVTGPAAAGWVTHESAVRRRRAHITDSTTHAAMPHEADHTQQDTDLGAHTGADVSGFTDEEVRRGLA